MNVLRKLLTLLLFIAIGVQFFLNEKLFERVNKLENLAEFYQTEVPKIVKTLDGKNNSYGTFLYGGKGSLFQDKLNYKKFLKIKKSLLITSV